MKKFLAFVMAASMALSLAACGGSTPASSTASTTTEATTEAAASGSKTDVAFVTDVGNIDDQSFNQYTWQGVQDFCSANSLNANYYRPTEDSDAARLEQMDNAVNDGAKAVVVAGYLFGSSIAEAQAKYPDVQFLALDVSTADLGDKAPTSNT
ncbi:BMP family ABC transporter substrate-binding protein, partial [Gemmiger sp.]|uniref:BMP family ABC transporter substrate-binding protein n=1 Tax=Gemmiger sp. TaxID=2049027 RepID=UPI002F94BF5A